MDTYYSIIQRAINSNRIFLPGSELSWGDPGHKFYKDVYEYEKENIDRNPFLTLTCYDAIYYAYITCGKNTGNLKKRTKVKFEILTGVLDNIFFTKEKKEAFLTLFCKVQKTYSAFAKLARLFKIRHAEIQVVEDLYMNPIKESDKNVLCIYQRGSKYLFTARDLANIINKSLTNNQDYFCDPLPIKNPYTNVTFTYAIMYNIYFFIKSCSMIMPQPLHLYFISDFNLTKFAADNECAIRDICIYNYVFNTPHDYLYEKIMYMIMTNSYTQKWFICKEFNKDTLIKIMLPYFYLSEIAQYSLNPDKKYQAGYELNGKLKLFYNFNPLFGRKIITPHSGVTSAINAACPDFHKVNVKVVTINNSEDDEDNHQEDDETVSMTSSSEEEQGIEEEDD